MVYNESEDWYSSQEYGLFKERCGGKLVGTVVSGSAARQAGAKCYGRELVLAAADSATSSPPPRVLS